MYLYHSLLCLTAAMKMGRDCSVSRSCCRRLHYHCPDCTHSIHCHHLVHFYWCSLLFLACWWRPFLSTWIQSCFGCGIVQQWSDFGIWSMECSRSFFCSSLRCTVVIYHIISLCTNIWSSINASDIILSEIEYLFLQIMHFP